ncbi:MAG: hypothetical protein MUF54_03120 [Polyangiaceae bacterium]|nr:hypothetical protein [Polyangiaceae bacterium]
MVHYRDRAASFLRSAEHLVEWDAAEHAPSIGLLAVHGSIALTDAVLVAVEGSRSKDDSHGEAVRRLKGWCAAKGLPDGGITHLDWLMKKKHDFSYGDHPVREADFSIAKVKMDQFFAWTFRTFPEVAQLEGSSDA